MFFEIKSRTSSAFQKTWEPAENHQGSQEESEFRLKQLMEQVGVLSSEIIIENLFSGND